MRTRMVIIPAQKNEDITLWHSLYDTYPLVIYYIAPIKNGDFP